MDSAGFVTMLAGLGFGLSLIIAIGAQNAFVLRQGLRREHVPVVVAVCALSDVVLIAVGVGGLGSLIEAAPWLLDTMRIGGAAFLLTYGLLAARRAWRPSTIDADPAGKPTSLRVAVTTCLALTWLNPHVYLDTVILLGSVAGTHGDDRWWFGLGAAVGSILWFSALGFGARLLRPLFARPAAWRVLDALIAAVMLAIAASLIRGLVVVKSFLIVALGGTFGTLSRYGIAQGVHPDTLFPLATFLVNLTGSFLLGALLATLIVRGDDIGHRRTLRLLLGTGFLGGYTTYSALAVETDTLLRTDHVALGLAYAVATVVGGLLAAFAGIVAARAVAR